MKDKTTRASINIWLVNLIIPQRYYLQYIKDISIKSHALCQIPKLLFSSQIIVYLVVYSTGK